MTTTSPLDLDILETHLSSLRGTPPATELAARYARDRDTLRLFALADLAAAETGNAPADYDVITGAGQRLTLGWDPASEAITVTVVGVTYRWWSDDDPLDVWEQVWNLTGPMPHLGHILAGYAAHLAAR